MARTPSCCAPRGGLHARMSKQRTAECTHATNEIHFGQVGADWERNEQRL